MRKRRRELAQNSDIAFLLIIFFMILAGIPTFSQIDLHLSEQEQSRGLSELETYHVLLTSTGELSLNGTLVEAHLFENVFSSSSEVVLSIEGGTPWQMVVGVLEVFQTIEISSFTMLEADP